MAENNIKKIKEFFGNSERPVANQEMMDFWKSLTEEEKTELKTSELIAASK